MGRRCMTGNIAIRQSFLGRIHVMLEWQVYRPAATLLDMDEEFKEFKDAKVGNLFSLEDVDPYFIVKKQNQDKHELTGLIRTKADFFGRLYLQVQIKKKIKRKGIFWNDTYEQEKLVWINAKIYHLSLKPS